MVTLRGTTIIAVSWLWQPRHKEVNLPNITQLARGRTTGFHARQPGPRIPLLTHPPGCPSLQRCESLFLMASCSGPFLSPSVSAAQTYSSGARLPLSRRDSERQDLIREELTLHYLILSYPGNDNMS